jgi:hypothetical protein
MEVELDVEHTTVPIYNHLNPKYIDKLHPITKGIKLAYFR